MSVPISKSTTSSTSHDQARSVTASNSINDVAAASLNKGCQFNNRNVCKVCNKLFSHKGNLKRHMQIHTRSYSCTKYDKAFTKKRYLTIHLRTYSHDQARSATASNSINNIANSSLNEGCQFNNRRVCKVCNKAFTRKDSLIRHMRTHTGEKPHPCTECNKTFVSKDYLIKHMLIHTGKKPHPCTDCDKAFTRKEGLKKHMQTHTGEKTFKSIKCNKGFTGTEGLKKHMQTHKEELKCTVCNKFFIYEKINKTFRDISPSSRSFKNKS